MNTEKTKLIGIGSKKHCKEKLNVSSKLHWGDSDFNLLRIDFLIELTQMSARQQKINKPRKNELKWCLELNIVQNNLNKLALLGGDWLNHRILNLNPFWKTVFSYFDFWKQVEKICFYAINDNEYIWFQYRILYRILGINVLLVKLENAENDTCRLCHCHVESLTHLFSECTVTNALWNNVVSWIETKISIKLHLDKISKTLGYLEQDNFFWPLNFF